MKRKYNINNLFIINICINEIGHLTVVEEKDNQYVDLYHPNFKIPYDDFERLVNNNIITYVKPLSKYFKQKRFKNKNLNYKQAVKMAYTCYDEFAIESLNSEYQKVI